MAKPKAEIFKKVHVTAAKLGGCDPQWLKNGEEPNFKAVELGESPVAGADPLTSPPIILLHGLLGALSNWDATMPCMAKYSHPIALHFPILTGHRSEVKVKALSAFTEYFMLKRELSPAILCGNSLGGHVALRLALAAPQSVKCLILSATSGLYEHSVDSLPIRPDKKFVREHMGRVFFNQKFVTDAAIDEIYNILSRRMNVLNLIHAARSAKKDNMLEELKHIKVPTLLLWGEDDLVTTMTVAETFQKNIPNSKLVSIKNCGHAPMIEYPEWFAEEVKKFLLENKLLNP